MSPTFDHHPFHQSSQDARGLPSMTRETAMDQVSIGTWLSCIIPTKHGVFRYLSSFFPFVQWITRYNLQWFIGDLIAGATVGAVVIPQGMAYAGLAQLPPEFGLYSSFMGVMVYWIFATSKDITIGPVAVMSIMVGNIVLKAQQSHPEIPAHVVASALSLVVGLVILLIGIVRADWIVELVPLVVTTAFMTGSAINIIVGQLPFLLGITGFDALDVPYKVVINTLTHVRQTTLDAAVGISALATLYLYRFICDLLARRMPKRQKLFFFLSTLRTALVISVYTIISFLINRNLHGRSVFRLVGHVPNGDLVASPAAIRQIWKTSPPDLIVFASGVVVTIFMGVEGGIYTTIGMSAAIHLFRVLRAKGTFLGAVEMGENELPKGCHRTAFVPVEYRSYPGSPGVVHTQRPGIFIYRFSEGFNYLNASRHMDDLLTTILANTKQAVPKISEKPGARPWNDPGPLPGQAPESRDFLPTLKAIIFDLSAVNSIDTTAVQQLVDVRNRLDSWASPYTVQWHFASISNPWTSRALRNAGFDSHLPSRDNRLDPSLNNHCFEKHCFHRDVGLALKVATEEIEFQLALEKIDTTNTQGIEGC